jgi:periplasmic divalent cation tolerance protein
MIRSTPYIVVYVTAPAKEAGSIAKSILKHKLAACVNIISGVRSSFWWQGAIDHAQESLLIVKTKRRCCVALRKHIASIHSYSVPEIIALPVIDGHAPYLRWIDESVGKSK